MLEISAEISISGGPFTEVSAKGGLQLSTEGIAGFIRVGAAANAGDPGAVDEIGGTGFDLAANAAVEINTLAEDVTMDGVHLAAKLTSRSAVRLHPVLDRQASSGSASKAASASSGSRTDGFAVSVKGLLLAIVDFDGGRPETHHADPAQRRRRPADRRLAPAEAIPLYTIAGRLAVSVGSN